MNPNHPLTIRRMEAIEKALRGRELNRHEIASEIHLSVRWVADYINHLHIDGKIHVCAWTTQAHEKAYPIQLYRWGAGKDARKPKPLSAKFKSAKARFKRDSDPEKRDRFLSLNRLRSRPPRVDPMVSALFGIAA